MITEHYQWPWWRCQVWQYLSCLYRSLAWAGEAITTHYSLFLKADHLAMGRGTEMMSVVIITSRGGYHRHQQPHVDTGTMGRIWTLNRDITSLQPGYGAADPAIITTHDTVWQLWHAARPGFSYISLGLAAGGPSCVPVIKCPRPSTAPRPAMMM